MMWLQGFSKENSKNFGPNSPGKTYFYKIKMLEQLKWIRKIDYNSVRTWAT